MSQTATATAAPSAHVSSAPGVFELQTLGGASNSRKGDAVSFQEEGITLSDSQREGDGSPPADAQSVVERWNYPRGNIGKMGFAFVSFMVAGMNDAAIGVSLIDT